MVLRQFLSLADMPKAQACDINKLIKIDSINENKNFKFPIL